MLRLLVVLFTLFVSVCVVEGSNCTMDIDFSVLNTRFGSEGCLGDEEGLRPDGVDLGLSHAMMLPNVPRVRFFLGGLGGKGEGGR